MNFNNNYSDEELFQLIKVDNSNALKILFTRYYEKLCYFVYGFVKEEQSSKELVADVFIIIWEKRKKIIVDRKAKSYLYTTAKNLSLNHLRKNKIHFERIDEVDQLMIAMQDYPDGSMNYKELKNVIDSLIDKLPEKRKLIFQMNKFDELKYEEIAEILGITVSTVRNQMIQAIKFMSTQYPSLKKIILLIAACFIK